MALSTIGNSGQTASVPATANSGAAPAVTVPSAAVPQAAPQMQPHPEQVQQAVQSMRQLVEARAPNSLSFAVDDATGKTIVRVSDAKTGEMIRQIPSEELIEIARSIDRLQGMLVREQA